MIPLKEVQENVLNRIRLNSTIMIPVRDALGCVVVDPIVSDCNVPAFNTTAVDGFAVSAETTKLATPNNPVCLQVRETIAAGKLNDLEPADSDVAYKIMTGAVMPKSCDASIMIEDVKITESEVQIFKPAQTGDYIRNLGSEISAGKTVIEANTVLTPAHLGLLSSIGITEIMTYSKPVVGVLSTGNEVVEPSQTNLAMGQIRDANRMSLINTLRNIDIDSIDLGIVQDNFEEVKKAIYDSVKKCDFVITTGGISMGEFDFLKAILSDLEGFNWHQIAIKPAKPFLFGVLDGVPIFCLPGNAVSCLVSFELLVRPALLKAQGHKHLYRDIFRAKLASDMLRKSDGKTHYYRVKIFVNKDKELMVRGFDGQSSHQLSGYASSNGLAIIADGQGSSIGSYVDVMYID